MQRVKPLNPISPSTLKEMYKSFRDMPVWQNALNLSAIVFELTISLPKSEDYGLTSQIRRSSNSVTGNIHPVK